ncbi:MAG: hypothetical protein HYW05_02225 [Candidatus Diapherotrites archaeon]|nr:hypothetical protein [Candidatus Diapherotrites archaeon]
MSALGILKKIVLAVLAFLLVSNLVALVLLLNFKAVAFEPTFYEDELEKLQVYGSAKNLIAELLVQQLPAQLTLIIPADRLEAEIKNAIPDSWMKVQFKSLTQNTLAYLKGEKEALELEISLSEVKSSLQAFAQDYIAKNIPPELAGAINLNQLLSSLPDTFDLTSMLPNLQQVEQARRIIQLFFLAINALIVSAVILFVLIILLTFRSLKSLLRWVSEPLIASGAVCISLAYTMPAVVKQMLSQQLGAAGGLAYGANTISAFIADFANAIFSGAMAYGIALLVIGLVLFIASFFIKKKI